MNAWANQSDCDINLAQTVSFADLTAGTSLEPGTCVVVEGYRADRALFGSLRDSKSKRAATSQRLKDRRVGLYADWERWGNPFAVPKKVRIVGRVGRCETQWPDAMMVMGYCHYTGGPIVLVATIKNL